MDICGTEYNPEDPKAFCQQLIGVAMYGPQAEAEAACMIALDHDDREVRETALTAVGHIARVNAGVAEVLLHRAIAALADPELCGRARHALDDVAVFVFHDRRGWKAVPGVSAD